jgi:tungstate transport system permease protein
MSWTPILEGVSEAVRLILSADKTVIEITSRSLQTAGYATLLASLIGVPLSILISMTEFRGKGTIKFLFNAMVGVPTVTLGLFLYTLFSRSGPLGYLGLLYTVPGMALGQAVLILPILVSFTVSALESKGQELRDLARTLGASEYEASIVVVREAYSGVTLALVSSFNRAFAELGIVTMLGANIRGVTRVLTTAIALETAKGELGLSFALSFILLAVVLSLNFLISLLQEGRLGRQGWLRFVMGER